MRLLPRLFGSLLFFSTLAFGNLPDTIDKVRPSIVGIGTYTPLGSPKAQLLGTGFVVMDGTYVATNHHVIPLRLNEDLNQKVVVFSGRGKENVLHDVEVVASSKHHDLAILKLKSGRLPAMSLGKKGSMLREGQDVVFTGFPIGEVLGLYPVTHRGMISAIAPVANPVPKTGHLSISVLKKLRDPYLVYQLDGTAYPGNSGSPMYHPQTGEVQAIINKVFVKESKETVIQNPSGITYAIPVEHLHSLIAEISP